MRATGEGKRKRVRRLTRIDAEGGWRFFGNDSRRARESVGKAKKLDFLPRREARRRGGRGAVVGILSSAVANRRFDAPSASPREKWGIKRKNMKLKARTEPPYVVKYFHLREKFAVAVNAGRPFLLTPGFNDNFHALFAYVNGRINENI